MINIDKPWNVDIEYMPASNFEGYKNKYRFVMMDVVE